MLGATAGTTDLTDGMFRHLVITGRSRLALYLARIPAGLAILAPAVALAFTMLCLVTSYEGIPQPTSVTMSGVSVPEYLDQAAAADVAAKTRAARPTDAVDRGARAARQRGAGPARRSGDIGTDLHQLRHERAQRLNPRINEMVKIGLWLELEIGIGFLVGLGLGLAHRAADVSDHRADRLRAHRDPDPGPMPIPYFLDGQRLIFGVAMDQLRPAAAGVRTPGGGGLGKVLFAGRGALAYRRCRPGR